MMNNERSESRMSAERRAEIARYKQCLKCGSLDVYEELLDELAAVTDECNELRRERDEARHALGAAMQNADNESRNCTDALVQVEALRQERDQARFASETYESAAVKALNERDKLSQNYDEVTKYYAEQSLENDRLAAEVERLSRDNHETCRELFQRRNDALRARVARLESLIERCLYTGSMTAPELDGLESELRAALDALAAKEGK